MKAHARLNFFLATQARTLAAFFPVLLCGFAVPSFSGRHQASFALYHATVSCKA
jgi:hypothetical protein